MQARAKGRICGRDTREYKAGVLPIVNVCALPELGWSEYESVAGCFVAECCITECCMSRSGAVGIVGTKAGIDVTRHEALGERIYVYREIPQDLGWTTTFIY